MQLVVFESEIRRNFEPLSLTKPTFDFLLGTRTLLARIENRLKQKASTLIVPKYLESVCKETHPSCWINEVTSGACVLVNSLVSPRYEILEEIQSSLADYGTNFAVVDSSKNVIFAALEHLETISFSESTVAMVGKKVIPEKSQNALLIYPWHLVVENEFAIEQDYTSFNNVSGWKRDSSNLRGPELLGKRNLMSGSAEIEKFVTLDSRKGPVIVDDGAIIQSFSHLLGPCYIGKSSIVKSAKIREGTTIGKECRVGGEVEASIVNDYSNKSHDGFLGHSIVGSWVNLGALTTNSDLKNTYGKIKMNIHGEDVNTGSIKVGCFLADMCKTSIGALIISGKSVGASSNVLGMISENVPSFTLYADSLSTGSKEIYLNSAIETQRRMMERRDVKMTDGYTEMMKSIFKMTSNERTDSGVKRGRFRF